ncbi:hypothetical protein D3C85_1297540 [compost metagenome]
MGYPDGQHAPLGRPANQLGHGHEQQQQRQTGDHLRHDQGRRHQATEQGPATEVRYPGQHEGGRGPQRHRGDGGVAGDLQGAQHRAYQLLVLEQAEVPLQRPASPHRHQLGGVEGVDHHDQHGQVDKQQPQPQHQLGKTEAPHTLPSRLQLNRDDRGTISSSFFIPCPPIPSPGCG